MMKLSASTKSEDTKDGVRLFLNTGPQLGQLPVRGPTRLQPGWHGTGLVAKIALSAARVAPEKLVPHQPAAPPLCGMLVAEER